MTKAEVETKKSIIESVTTPLAFLVFGFLVVDGTIAGLAVALPDYRQLLVWTIVISIFLFTLTVVLMAILRPESLKGDRPLQEIHARQFAGDLFQALDGSLQNLPPLEREEAWLTLADVITNDSGADSAYTNFCSRVASRVKVLTNLTSKKTRTTGTIK